MSPTPGKNNSERPNGASGGAQQSAYHDVYDAWSGFYQKMSDEGIDFFQKSMEMAQTMMPFPNSELMNLWIDNYQEFVRRMGREASSAGASASGFGADYRNIYELWLDTWSKNLDMYLRTPEFAAKSGRDLETFSDLKKQYSQFMESYWEALHLPSSADMREIYHKLYIIDRKLDDLDRRVRASETEGKSAGRGKKE